MPIARSLIQLVLPSRYVKRSLWRRWYRYFDGKVQGRPIAFLNFGMAAPNGEVIEVPQEWEPERSSVQLYHCTIRPADLTGATVLEVSCGRGGGAKYMASRTETRTVIGLDQTDSALAFCRRQHPRANLHFVCGDALALPFMENRFDAVVNIEASHCYPNMPKFLAEVRRALRPGGWFLYADFRAARRIPQWQAQLRECGLIKTEEEDITEHVVESLAQTHDRRANLMAEVAPRIMRRAFSQFAGTRGSVMFRAFERRRACYLRFAFQKR